jgi:acyl-CoA synthetase (AMP-forming)/AMP-acid ligase II
LAGLKKHIAEADPDFVLDIEEMPPLGQTYPNLGAETPDCSFQTYPTQISPVQLDETGFYLHSSGSTGFPKAVPLTHRVLAQSLTFHMSNSLFFLLNMAEIGFRSQPWSPSGWIILDSP